MFNRFPSLHQVCDSQKADYEWRDHSKLPPSYFGNDCDTSEDVSRLPRDIYWKVVLKTEIPNVNTKQLRFPNLAKCIFLLLGLPFANVDAERIFSQLKRIKSDRRTGLHNLSVSSFLKLKRF